MTQQASRSGASAGSEPAVARKMLDFMDRSSWIRKMFEEGARMKVEFGPDEVCDFSLGNPDLVPPPAFQEALERMAADRSPGVHSYMPNAGSPSVRRRVAEYLGRDHGVRLGADDILMTCGAAGGLNVIFKALLNPGDEVIVSRPYFVEYGFYVDNHGGRLVPVASRLDFGLDLAAIEEAITSRTKAVLLNSPNNPSGVIYKSESLKALAQLLSKASARIGRAIYLVADEPYRRLVFSGAIVPPILKWYRESVIATSFSKDLSIPGERIGYVAIHPETAEKDALVGAFTLANRILGFVNAPVLMQRVVAEAVSACVDVSVYERRRDRLAEILTEAGYEFQLPEGAFYFFPRTPIPDDVAFVRFLGEERILAVPGVGFGAPGHFRIAFCVDDALIERSAAGFRRAVEKAKRHESGD